MKEYLCLVVSSQRFYFNATKDVLYSSILRRHKQAVDFSLTKFCHAWEMLGMYASNLLSQPWRKEFKEIRVCNATVSISLHLNHQYDKLQLYSI